jgi:hypothetical protein
MPTEHLEPQPGGILDLEERPARGGEVAHIGHLAGDHAVEGCDDPGIGEEGLGLVHGSQRDALAGLDSVEFGAGDSFLSQQGREPQQVGVGLFLQGQRLVQPRLNLGGVQLCQKIARLDPLAGNHRHRLNSAAHFGLDHRP